MKYYRGMTTGLCAVMFMCVFGVQCVTDAFAGETICVQGYLIAQNEGSALPSSDDHESLDLEDDFDFFEEDGDEDVDAAVADPLEPWNRAMFVFNDKAYFWVIKPLAQGVKAVVPHGARQGIDNFFHNLKMPIRFVNSVLQGKGRAAMGELCRFSYNTTVGVLGFGNPASKHPFMNPDPEDFGQSLGVTGMGHGIYIVWPILGRSSLRDTVGLVGDYFLNPVSYVTPDMASRGISAGEMVNRASLHIGEYESFKAAVVEPYTAARDAYVQQRKARVSK